MQSISFIRIYDRLWVEIIMNVFFLSHDREKPVATIALILDRMPFK